MHNLTRATVHLCALDELQIFLTPKASRMIGSSSALTDEMIVPPSIAWPTDSTPVRWTDGRFNFELTSVSRTLGLWSVQWTPADAHSPLMAH